MDGTTSTPSPSSASRFRDSPKWLHKLSRRHSNSVNHLGVLQVTLVEICGFLQQAFSTHCSPSPDNSSGETSQTPEQPFTDLESDREQLSFQNRSSDDSIFDSFAPQPAEG